MFGDTRTLIKLWAFAIVACALLALVYFIWLQPGQGRVTGLFFSFDDPVAIIDGQIVHVGQNIHGVEVVKVDRTIVEFDDGRTKWVQRVGEKPNPAWQRKYQDARSAAASEAHNTVRDE